MCTPYVVDEATKQKIAAWNAEFCKASSSPFGRDDQIGMLNLIDAGSRDAIMSRADAGKVFDLAVDHFVGMPAWIAANDPGYQIWMTHTPRGEELADVMGIGPEANELISYSGDAVFGCDGRELLTGLQHRPRLGVVERHGTEVLYRYVLGRCSL